MNKEEMLKLIHTLIGNIKPIGDQRIDDDAKINLELLISIMKELHLEIDEIASMENSPYASIKEVSIVANNYLDFLGIPK